MAGGQKEVEITAANGVQGEPELSRMRTVKLTIW